VHPDGRTETLAEGSFPGAQSSYRAELWGLLAARSHTSGRATFGVDCLNLLHDVENTTAGLAVDTGSGAAFMELPRLLRREDHPAQLLKVLAHRKARLGASDTPCGNALADARADRAVKLRLPLIVLASPCGPAPPQPLPHTTLTTGPRPRFVSPTDNKPLKRDAFEAFALQHVLAAREAKRRSSRPSVMADMAHVTVEVGIIPGVSSAFVRNKALAGRAKTWARCYRGRAWFPKWKKPCLLCGAKVLNACHWRLACKGMSDFRADAHNKVVLLVAQAIRDGDTPPAFLLLNAGTREGECEWTIPKELLPHLGAPGDRGFPDTPGIVCVYTSSWGGPCSPIHDPSDITLVPVEVAITNELTRWGPDASAVGTPDARPAPTQRAACNGGNQGGVIRPPHGVAHAARL
jgi:hypothetical protein